MATSERIPQESSELKGTEEKIAELHRLKAGAVLGGGKKRIEAQHNKGKLTARERLDLKISQSLVVRFPRHTPRKFARLWTWL